MLDRYAQLNEFRLALEWPSADERREAALRRAREDYALGLIDLEKLEARIEEALRPSYRPY